MSGRTFWDRSGSSDNETDCILSVIIKITIVKLFNVVSGRESERLVRIEAAKDEKKVKKTMTLADYFIAS